MDTLSSLFSKKFKKNPPLLKFHGLNEDLFEGQKLISKRKRTQARIKKTSPLVEGFTSQLSDVDTTEFKRTAHLNQTLQKDLSSYATAYRNVLSDYVTAQSESQKCKEDCGSQYPPPGAAGPTPTAAPDVCSSDNVEACTTCEECYAQGPGWWCSDTGTCSTHGNPCTESCGGGGYQTTAAAEGNSLCGVGGVERCTTCQSCYAQGPGWWCSDTGTCSTRGNPCMESCGGGGYQSNAEAIAGKRAEREAAAERVAAEAAAEDEASRELAINKKQACLAGCGLSKAYLEETNITGSYNNKNITECAALTTQCTDEDVTGCTTCESCFAKGPGWWCSDTGTCSTRGNPCMESCGGGGLQSTPGTSNQITNGSPSLTDACNKSKNAAQIAQNTEMDGRNLTQEYSALKDNYLSSGTNMSGKRGPQEAYGFLRSSCPAESTCAISNAAGSSSVDLAGYTPSTWRGSGGIPNAPTGSITLENAINWCKNDTACQGVTTTAASAENQVVGEHLLFTTLPGTSTNFDPMGVGDWVSYCKGGCSKGTGLPQTPNILLEDTGGLSSRIDNILSNRRGIQTNSRDSRQNLENTLKSYKTEYNKLQNREQDGSTLSAMMSEGKLKKSSASLKYLVWLGLAICMLMMAIRQLKK